MEGCLGEAQSDKLAMEEQLSLIQSQHSDIQDEKCSLLETVGELQRQLKEIQAVLEKRKFEECVTYCTASHRHSVW